MDWNNHFGKMEEAYNEYDFSDLFDNLRDGVYITDLKRKILYWNKAAEDITGFSASEVRGFYCANNVLCHVDNEGHNLCVSRCPISEVLRDGCSREHELLLHHKKGHRVSVWVRTIPLRNRKGSLVGAIEFFNDFAFKKVLENRIRDLEELCLTDIATGLANQDRILFELKSFIAEKERYGLSFGVLYFKLTNYKKIEEDYGKESGKQILKSLGMTVQTTGRIFDSFGRLDDDEFVGIIRGVDSSGLMVVANRLKTLVESSFIMHSKGRVTPMIAIGATIVREGEAKEEILARAKGLMVQSAEKKGSFIGNDF